MMAMFIQLKRNLVTVTSDFLSSPSNPERTIVIWSKIMYLHLQATAKYLMFASISLPFSEPKWS